MEVGLDINENNQILVYSFDGENGMIRTEISDEVLNGINQGYLYKFENNEFVRDFDREKLIENQIKIDDLKQKLVDTDYVVSKAMEYNLTGKTLSEDDSLILNSRDTWREQINTLETEINQLI